MIRLSHACGCAPNANPVRAHDDRSLHPRLIEILSAECRRVTRAKLEDIPNLDPLLEPNGRTAGGTTVTRLRRCEIHHVVWGEVTGDVDVLEVVPLLVCASNKICGGGHEFVNHHECPLRANRRGVARHHVCGHDLLFACWTKIARANRVRQFRLLHIIIAPHNGNDQPIVAICKEDCLRGLLVRDAEQFGECLNRWRVWGLHLFAREWCRRNRRCPAHTRDLPI